MTILANDIVVGNFSYESPTVEDTKQVRLTAVGEATEVNIQIIAVDVQGKANSVTIPVKLTKEDTDKPVLDNTAIKVVGIEGGYEMTLGFTDKTSGVDNVVVTLPDSSKKTLQGSVVKFTSPNLGTVSYVAKDTFGNSLE